MLGGYGKFSSGEVTKAFENIPDHQYIRITAKFHFIDVSFLLKKNAIQRN